MENFLIWKKQKFQVDSNLNEIEFEFFELVKESEWFE